MNVTPLVDVVLVLLIIFMVVLPAMEEGVQIDFPTIDNADEATAEDMEEPFMLAIARNGAYYIDNTPLRPEAFEQEMRRRHEAQRRRKIVLRVDGGVQYGRVRDMMALCREIGFPGVSLRVNERSSGDEGAQARAGSGSSEGMLASAGH